MTNAKGDTFTYMRVLPTPGEPCPTCGRKVPLSGAERQRRYRERRAEALLAEERLLKKYEN